MTNNTNTLMNFEGMNVEIFEFEGKVLFNPRHVAECLGIKNVSDNLRKMNPKQVIKLSNSKLGNNDFRKLHNTGENFITESGVYDLLFKSRKAEAIRFKDWVTDEALPTIRKTGTYMTDLTVEKLLADPSLIIKLAQQVQIEKEKVQSKNLI